MILLARARSRTKSPDIKTSSSFRQVSWMKKFQKCQEIFYPGRVQAFSESWPDQIAQYSMRDPHPHLFPHCLKFSKNRNFTIFFYHFLFGSLQHIRLCSGVSMLVAMIGLKRLFTFFNCCKFFQLTARWCKWIMFIKPLRCDKEIENTTFK